MKFLHDSNNLIIFKLLIQLIRLKFIHSNLSHDINQPSPFSINTIIEEMKKTRSFTFDDHFTNFGNLLGKLIWLISAYWL